MENIILPWDSVCKYENFCYIFIVVCVPLLVQITIVIRTESNGKSKMLQLPLEEKFRGNLMGAPVPVLTA